jgi:hypothetical protein
MQYNRIGVVMVSVLKSSAVDRGFNPQSGQTKDFSTKHAALYMLQRTIHVIICHINI